MHDATASRHPIHRAWADRHHRAEAVTVNYFAVEQVCDGSEVDVRMWTDINTLSDTELDRPHMVDENERADHLPHPRRQCPANLKSAKIAGAGHDHCFDRAGHMHLAVRRIRTRLPTYVRSL